jgi:probable F420-dependent oxidoreductase
MRPFRFVASVPRLGRTPGQWRDDVRRIEDLGFSAVSISDHLTAGWGMEATVAMMAAADATSTLRVQSLVLANDFRHPAVLHKALATIDVFSGGRLEIGLGTGWMASDYASTGLSLDPAAERSGRLEETVHILKGLFGEPAFSFNGEHYRIAELEGLPKPVQHPHPPLLLGGGGKRILSLAAREADIVSVYPSLRAGRLTTDLAADLSPDRTAEQVQWVRDAASAAGRQPADIELHLSLFMCNITTSAGQAQTYLSSQAAALEADPSLLRTSPAVLAGSLEQCAEALLARRERYGFSCIKLGADVVATAPLVALLAGT